jgi:hypothetical protein
MRSILLNDTTSRRFAMLCRKEIAAPGRAGAARPLFQGLRFAQIVIKLIMVCLAAWRQVMGPWIWV